MDMDCASFYLEPMPKHVQRSPEERRAIVERIVAESGGKAPASVSLLEFREGKPAEFEHAKSLQGRLPSPAVKILSVLT